MRCLRRILVNSWQDKIHKAEVLAMASRMQDGKIPMDFLYGQLAAGKRRTGHPQLRYSDTRRMQEGHEGYQH